MKKINGTTGRIAVADLGSGEVRVTEIPDEYRRDYLGGKGLALRFFMSAAAGSSGRWIPWEMRTCCVFSPG